MTSKFCSNCGEATDPNQKFCENCGASFQDRKCSLETILVRSYLRKHPSTRFS